MSSPPDHASSQPSSFYSQLNASMRRLGRHRAQSSEPPPLPNAPAPTTKGTLKKLLSIKPLRSASAAPPERERRPSASPRAAQVSTESFFCRDSMSPGDSPPPVLDRMRRPSAPPPVPPLPSTARTMVAPELWPAVPTRTDGRLPEAAQPPSMTVVQNYRQPSQAAQMQNYAWPAPLQSPLGNAAGSSVGSVGNASMSSRPTRSSDASGSHRIGPFARSTLRGYAQRGVLQDLGLRLYGPPSAANDRVSVDRRGAVDVLLAAAWGAFLESSGTPPQGVGSSRREQLERAYGEARHQLELAGRTYGMSRIAARALGERAQDQWRDLNFRPESITAESHEPWQLANASSRPHSLRECKEALVRICHSDRLVGPLRVAYILGTALRLGEHLRSINEVPEHELAVDDHDFVALVRSLWKSPETELLIYVYRQQMRALSEPKDKGF